MKRLLATCAANNRNYNKIDKTSLAYTEGEIYKLNDMKRCILCT